MQDIFEDIADRKQTTFSMEEGSWFNGQMNVPVKKYYLSFPSTLGTLHLRGEYRRNTWRKANWRKDLHGTDIYLWNIKVVSKNNLPSVVINANSWWKRTVLRKPAIHVSCHDDELKKQLESSKKIQRLLVGPEEKVSATIRIKDNTIWTTFNSLIAHERMINEAISVIEEIELKLQMVMTD